jgi:hypothetical protein
MPEFSPVIDFKECRLSFQLDAVNMKKELAPVVDIAILCISRWYLVHLNAVSTVKCTKNILNIENALNLERINAAKKINIGVAEAVLTREIKKKIKAIKNETEAPVKNNLRETVKKEEQ